VPAPYPLFLWRYSWRPLAAKTPILRHPRYQAEASLDKAGKPRPVKEKARVLPAQAVEPPADAIQASQPARRKAAGAPAMEARAAPARAVRLKAKAATRPASDQAAITRIWLRLPSARSSPFTGATSALPAP
jgi:membrane protein involved in colicin uptake